MEHSPETTQPMPALFSFGGGKGGVGKSLVCASVAVDLARRGLRVVALDADLGAANLHTLLGVLQPDRSIDDFLVGRVKSLNAVAMPTAIPGLSLISGAAALLGSATPRPAQKRRLVEALVRLDADVVLVDLGAGTHINVLDLFNCAGVGLIVTGPEPTSIQNAYSFVKGAVLRLLELGLSPFEFMPSLLERALEPRDPTRLESVDALMAAIRERSTLAGEAGQALLNRFPGRLVVNQATPKEDRRVRGALSVVCQRYLGIELGYLGALPSDPAAQRLIKRMKPLILEGEDGPLGPAVTRLVDTLLAAPGQPFPELLIAPEPEPRRPPPVVQPAAQVQEVPGPVEPVRREPTKGPPPLPPEVFEERRRPVEPAPAWDALDNAGWPADSPDPAPQEVPAPPDEPLDELEWVDASLAEEREPPEADAEAAAVEPREPEEGESQSSAEPDVFAEPAAEPDVFAAPAVEPEGAESDVFAEPDDIFAEPDALAAPTAEPEGIEPAEPDAPAADVFTKLEPEPDVFAAPAAEPDALAAPTAEPEGIEPADDVFAAAPEPDDVFAEPDALAAPAAEPEGIELAEPDAPAADVFAKLDVFAEPAAEPDVFATPAVEREGAEPDALAAPAAEPEGVELADVFAEPDDVFAAAPEPDDVFAEPDALAAPTAEPEGIELAEPDAPAADVFAKLDVFAEPAAEPDVFAAPAVEREGAEPDLVAAPEGVELADVFAEPDDVFAAAPEPDDVFAEPDALAAPTAESEGIEPAEPDAKLDVFAEPAAEPDVFATPAVEREGAEPDLVAAPAAEPEVELAEPDVFAEPDVLATPTAEPDAVPAEPDVLATPAAEPDASETSLSERELSHFSGPAEMHEDPFGDEGLPVVQPRQAIPGLSAAVLDALAQAKLGTPAFSGDDDPWNSVDLAALSDAVEAPLTERFSGALPDPPGHEVTALDEELTRGGVRLHLQTADLAPALPLVRVSVWMNGTRLAKADHDYRDLLGLDGIPREPDRISKRLASLHAWYASQVAAIGVDGVSWRDRAGWEPPA